MPNMRDHALAVGEQTLAERPFDALDALILTQLVYMPMEGRLDTGDQCTIAQAWAFLNEHCDCKALDIFQQKRYRLTQTCAELARYSGWIMRDYVNHIDPELEMQFCACAYVLPGGLNFISFRGTDLSVAGWKEDLNMSYMTVPSQREAVAYVRRQALRDDCALVLGGHSKGGNLAVYAGACVDEPTRARIRQVYSFDGPGLDEDTLRSPGYALMTQRIESYIPQSSVVGMLLNYHPIYTVVRARSAGILQHDAMTWQIEDGAFVTMDELDMNGKITDEALHAWLGGMTMEDRRLLVDTLYHVVDAAQAELVTDFSDDWRDSATKALEALRELTPAVKRDVGNMIRSLFSTGASEVVKALLPGVAKLGRPVEHDE